MSTKEDMHEDEKQVESAEVASLVDASEGDEALELVGRERTAQFSEEYNRKLLRKLVRCSSCYVLLLAQNSAVGLAHPSAMRRRLLHPVSVRSDPAFRSASLA